MTTKNSARVIETKNGHEVAVDHEIAVDYYVRAVATGVRPLDNGESERDGWAAYREEPVFVTVGTERRQYLHVERVSDAPRATVEGAAADMWAAIRVHTDPDRPVPARLVRRGSEVANTSPAAGSDGPELCDACEGSGFRGPFGEAPCPCVANPATTDTPTPTTLVIATGGGKVSIVPGPVPERFEAGVSLVGEFHTPEEAAVAAARWLEEDAAYSTPEGVAERARLAGLGGG